jgi:ABC-type cobalt transport system substrate-binding protein
MAILKAFSMKGHYAKLDEDDTESRGEVESECSNSTQPLEASDPVITRFRALILCALYTILLLIIGYTIGYSQGRRQSLPKLYDSDCRSYYQSMQ